ncbi:MULTISPECIES: tyrosine-protein phosphatase [Rhodococcus]|uniref:Tyrosine-protein phosphatase n=1 Tax=Rhodococcus oxybenzonivorans TaxID=1990687 RepID=A0AAE5A6E2_9NOCA|nr:MULTISPECIES: tyrosine-protein phosphatase [Rhodococcus]MDV7242849.1 tyrosine-protein phosphatase [Rhodococcus oxybenzonivorans]MDV7265552.1 tyrosine-protein phosphatase [Rhodococcus oxybenzonivorans]MDV7275253.1 tyrosine-protein phosphatase [Rhodococcus oxybenzonivorans]MDV7334892.1 tyrosine-protein phosphatase [Rhodococcus oxybenzonivorans]MDV7345046.1 tyrosine-protein phosphatase [Rhodococcus oxybenzonivorans]
MTSTLPASTNHRRLNLTGTYNFRDLGGFPTDTGTTKWNKLFRSDALHQLDQPARNLLRKRRLALVIDLREQQELDDSPSALDGVGHRVEHLPVYEGEIDLDGTNFDLAVVYHIMVENYGHRLTRAVRAIAASGDDPTVVHCTAGKDRTGLVVALTLAAVGVDQRDIVADYAMSETLLAGDWAIGMAEKMRARGLPDDVDVDHLVGASPAALMRTTLDSIAAAHGGVRDYLLGHGMTERELDDLRGALVA